MEISTVIAKLIEIHRQYQRTAGIPTRTRCRRQFVR